MAREAGRERLARRHVHDLLDPAALGISIDEISVAIQGYGKVGGYAAQLLHDAGCRVVAVSDVEGGLYREKGLDPEAINRHKQAAGSVAGFPGAEAISNEELLELECDVLVPAAVEGVISVKNADNVKAKIVCEAANGPVTFEGDKILNERGIFVVPDIVANSGGVTVSYFEWVQDIQAYFWSDERSTTASARSWSGPSTRYTSCPRRASACARPPIGSASAGSPRPTRCAASSLNLRIFVRTREILKCQGAAGRA